MERERERVTAPGEGVRLAEEPTMAGAGRGGGDFNGLRTPGFKSQRPGLIIPVLANNTGVHWEARQAPTLTAPRVIVHSVQKLFTIRATARVASGDKSAILNHGFHRIHEATQNTEIRRKLDGTKASEHENVGYKHWCSR